MIYPKTDTYHFFFDINRRLRSLGVCQSNKNPINLHQNVYSE